VRLITLVFTAAAIALPFSVHAQAPTRDVIPSVPAPRDPLPRFTIAPRGGGLPPVGLPLPPHGMRPAAGRPGNPDRHHRHGAVYTYWPMTWFYAPPFVVEPPPPPAPEPEPVTPGRLFLDIQPGGSQIFADGYYVGLAEDFGAQRGGGLIDAGIHRIDISATGYEPVAVEVRVTPGQSITYRAALKALPPPAAVPPSTFYLIPGCYMGNVPPKDAHLPPTCDPRLATTWKP
jgi:hypothetical protein